MGGGSDSESDAPEEFTAEQGIKQDEEIRKVQRENMMRVVQEGKERRRQWAQRKTQVESGIQGALEVKEIDPQQESQDIPGMLPSSIVNFLADREKKTFSSDSEDEVIDHKPTARKKKQKIIGPETVLLNDVRPAPCLKNSMIFLESRKTKVLRSRSVLKNANQALRLLSSRGCL